MIEAAQVDIQLFAGAVAVKDDAVAFVVVGEDFFCCDVFDAFVAAEPTLFGSRPLSGSRNTRSQQTEFAETTYVASVSVLHGGAPII